MKCFVDHLLDTPEKANKEDISHISPYTILFYSFECVCDFSGWEASGGSHSTLLTGCSGTMHSLFRGCRTVDFFLQFFENYFIICPCKTGGASRLVTRYGVS